MTTASIDNNLYSAIQNQAIREAKADHQKDGAVSYRTSQPFAINNQNWEIDTTENGSVVHLQSVRLQTQKHEWSDPTVALEDW